MNKLEANLVLVSITFFWGIQYVFLKNIPDDISTFAFLTLTNGIGFILVALMFFRDLRKLTRKIVKGSLLLAVLLFGMNAMLTIGSRQLEASVSSFLAASYIIFIPIVLLFFKSKVTRQNICGIICALIGLLLATGATLSAGITPGVLLVIGADIFFAVYIVVLEKVVGDASPVLLAMGQMFFGTLFSLVGWAITQPQTMQSLPTDTAFWVSVLVIALFVRGFTTIMQVYAQRYVSAISASLIFSTEIIFTLVTSLFLPAMIGGQVERLTLPKIVGCALIVCGVLISDGTFRLPKKEAV